MSIREHDDKVGVMLETYRMLFDRIKRCAAATLNMRPLRSDVQWIGARVERDRRQVNPILGDASGDPEEAFQNLFRNTPGRIDGEKNRCAEFFDLLVGRQEDSGEQPGNPSTGWRPPLFERQTDARSNAAGHDLIPADSDGFNHDPNCTELTDFTITPRTYGLSKTSLCLRCKFFQRITYRLLRTL